MIWGCFIIYFLSLWQFCKIHLSFGFWSLLRKFLLSARFIVGIHNGFCVQSDLNDYPLPKISQGNLKSFIKPEGLSLIFFLYFSQWFILKSRQRWLKLRVERSKLNLLVQNCPIVVLTSLGKSLTSTGKFWSERKTENALKGHIYLLDFEKIVLKSLNLTRNIFLNFYS